MRSVVKIVMKIALAVAIVAAIIITAVELTRTGPDECVVLNQLPEFSISKEDNIFVVSWQPSSYDWKCGVTYILRYRIDDGEETQVELADTFYVISDVSLELCSLMTAFLWAIGKDGSTNYMTATDYREIPTNLNLNNIEYNNVDDGLLITWDRPIELTRCPVRYTISMTSDLGTFFVESDIERAIIPDDKYCFQMRFVFRAYVGLRISLYNLRWHTTRGGIENIQMKVAPDISDELIVTWDNLTKEELCSIEYHVEYSSDVSADNQLRIVTDPEASFKFTYCDEAIVDIISYGLNETTMGSSDTVDATQYPKYIITIDTTNEETAISHDSIPQTDTCNVTYLAIITTDLGNFTYSTESIIESLEGSYCFYRRFQIHPVIGNHIGEPTVVEFYKNLPPVENLELVEEGSNDTLIATWTGHQRQELCGIEYAVTYGDSSFNETTITTETSTSFDISYCTTVFVIVEAISGDVISKSNLVTYDTGSPTSIGQVKSITAIRSASVSVAIFWNPPDYVNFCNIIYTVTATHTSGDVDSCSGHSSCDIPLRNFCPNTTMSIVASTLDGAPISGEPAEYTYEC